MDTGSGSEYPASRESPEDVVRRLMDAEAGGHSPATPASHKKATPEKTPAKAGHVGKLVRRMTATPRRMIGNAFAKARTAILSYRPTPRQMAILLVAVIALTMPWLIPVLVLLGLIIVVISYLSFGHDRSAELVAGWYEWLARHNPQGAEQLRARAERISARLAIWSEYLPESWTNGLYLPDFALPGEVPEKLADDPYERLAGEPRHR